ncbi:MAG: alanine racemase [Candidatus Zixiibacteriota bacterium]
MPKKKLLNWIELSRSALKKNISSLARLATGKILSVSVKANAYGHGLTEIVTMLNTNKAVKYLTVHSLEEAVQCRQTGWNKKIMMLGPIPLSDTDAIIEYDLEPVIFNQECLNKLGKAGKKYTKHIKTHLKLETGTNRQGVMEEDLPEFAEIYKKYNSLKKPYGASTHFANIEDTTNHEYALYQLGRFNRMIDILDSLNQKPAVRHTASSAATLLFEKTHFELVRPGIAVYGHWPSKETYLSYQHKGGQNKLFKPVLTWKTRVTQIKQIPPDSFVGYGCTYRTTSDACLAVLPIGYYDGYPRALSNQAYVLINGKRAPVRGRVCMNLTMVDITDIQKVKYEDEAIIIGASQKEILSAEQLAEWVKTINYEILARLSSAINRKIVP